jgi:thiol-disulfide isomerase/thioredoxin
MKRWEMAIPAAAFLLAAIVLLLVSGRSSRPLWARDAAARAAHPAAAKNANSPDSDIVLRFAKDPQPMPPFLVTDVKGEVISSAAWRGKVVIVNFWATWCPPCREEIPELVDLQARYKDQLQIVAVSVDEDLPASAIKRFAEKFEMNFPVVLASPALVREYEGASALPTNFVINREGRVVQKHVGVFPEQLYDLEVRSLAGLPVDARVEEFIDVGQIFLSKVSNATELPDVDMSKLTPELKRVALHRLNSEGCSCGCKLTLAQCRMIDSACQVSKGMAAKVVKEVSNGKFNLQEERDQAAPLPTPPDAAPN